MHYWAEDTSGTVLDTSLGAPNTANGWIYGTGANLSTSGPNPINAQNPNTITFTIPPTNTDGIVYLNFLILDPQVGHGGITLIDHPVDCPHPEIAVAKDVVGQPVAQPDGTFAVTYEVEVENTGAFDLTLSLIHI